MARKRLPGTCLAANLQSPRDDMLAIFFHTAPTPHTHPDQMAVAFVFAAAVVGASWILQRRRS